MVWALMETGKKGEGERMLALGPGDNYFIWNGFSE